MKILPIYFIKCIYQTSYNLNILHTMKTNQIFVKKLSDKALVINNHTYNLSTMNEEELLKLSQLLDDFRKQQVGKISTAELIFASYSEPAVRVFSSSKQSLMIFSLLSHDCISVMNSPYFSTAKSANDVAPRPDKTTRMSS